MTAFDNPVPEGIGRASLQRFWVWVRVLYAFSSLVRGGGGWRTPLVWGGFAPILSCTFWMQTRARAPPPHTLLQGNTHTHTHTHTDTHPQKQVRKHKKSGWREILRSCRAALDVFRSAEELKGWVETSCRRGQRRTRLRSPPQSNPPPPTHTERERERERNAGVHMMRVLLRGLYLWAGRGHRGRRL